MENTEYSVYILYCDDGSYYTGISTDVERRLKEHENSSRGARYLRGRGPLKLVFSEVVGGRSKASSLEYRIKRLNRSEKKALIDGVQSLQTLWTD
ncbi:MAG: GIY-YIG nuclease family protein [Woeseiaceae bacterium]|jgi:putative endonuclease|nr:GIY-YIG nuclease family protein [Woeseiaceae bacterium]